MNCSSYLKTLLQSFEDFNVHHLRKSFIRPCSLLRTLSAVDLSLTPQFRSGVNFHHFTMRSVSRIEFSNADKVRPHRFSAPPGNCLCYGCGLL